MFVIIIVFNDDIWLHNLTSRFWSSSKENHKYLTHAFTRLSFSCPISHPLKESTFQKPLNILWKLCWMNIRLPQHQPVCNYYEISAVHSGMFLNYVNCPPSQISWTWIQISEKPNFLLSLLSCISVLNVSHNKFGGENLYRAHFARMWMDSKVCRTPWIPVFCFFF